MIIDCSSTADRVPVVADAACLEVSLVFPFDGEDSWLKDGAEAAREWLRAAYQAPLNAAGVPPSGVGEAGRLADAVRAIRMAAWQYETNPIVYAFAVGSYLIRYASYADNGTLDRRAVAYALACRLFAGIAEHCEPRAAA